MSQQPQSPDTPKVRTDPYKSWSEDMIGQGELSQRSVDKYETLWKAWRGWLESRTRDWHTVDGTLIEEFLQGAAPGKGGRRKAINAEHMSSYTRQRYWRLLRGVYATAVKDGKIQANPVLDIPEEARPSISNRDRQSQVLEPFIFARLRDPKTIEKIIPVKTAADWWHRRDRAIMALLVDTGITTSELQSLRGMDISRADRQPLDPDQFSLEQETPAKLVIDVMDSSEIVGRTLTLSDSVTPVMIEWLRERQTLLVERAARTDALTKRGEFLRMHERQGPLFVARRARAATSLLPPMEPVTLYYTVSQALKKLRKLVGAGSSALDLNEPHVAKGPAVIRNSVIRNWLDTVGPAETVLRAGLKNIESLRLKVDWKEPTT